MLSRTAKPRSFRAGDGWFAHNLAVNLVVHQCWIEG